MSIDINEILLDIRRTLCSVWVTFCWTVSFHTFNLSQVRYPLVNQKCQNNKRQGDTINVIEFQEQQFVKRVKQIIKNKKVQQRQKNIVTVRLPEQDILYLALFVNKTSAREHL